MTPKRLRSEETAQRVQGTTARATLRTRGASSRRGLADLSLGAHALEILCSHRSLGGPGDRPDGVWVSMVLTSTPLRRRGPKTTRGIPTISAGRADAGPANVSAVDTGLRRSKSVGLAAVPGASVTGPPPPTPARHLRWGPVVRVRLRPHRRVSLLHEGRDPLAEGCAYCTKAPPTRSAPHPRPLAPTPRAVHPDDDGNHHSDRVSPLRQAEAAALPSGRRTPPVS